MEGRWDIYRDFLHLHALKMVRKKQKVRDWRDSQTLQPLKSQMKVLCEEE